MARRRFFVDEIRQSRAVIHGEDARHLTRVLRVERGQQFEISDNRSVYLAEVETLGKDQVGFRIIEPVHDPEVPAQIDLLLALIKFDRFEWAIEKATELGVAAVIPVIAERSEKGLDRAAEKRLERWRKIAKESSQQSRRAHLPEVREPVQLNEALGSAYNARFLLEEQQTAAPLLRCLPERRSPEDRLAVLIGPEGGWTDQERAAAAQAGWTPVSLGPTILRAETAAIAAISVLLNAWLA